LESDGPMTTENLRREARVEAKVVVEIQRKRSTMMVETADVSFKGLFVRTAEPLPLRSLVRLRIGLPSRLLEAHAMVVHVVDGGGAGLQFWGLSGKDRAAWDDFVRGLVAAKRKTLSKPPADLEQPTPTGVRLVRPADLADDGTNQRRR
jgi:hypothetical protein